MEGKGSVYGDIFRRNKLNRTQFVLDSVPCDILMDAVKAGLRLVFAVAG